MGSGEAAVTPRVTGLVIVERTMLIAAGDLSLLEHSGGAALDLAVAGLGELAAVLLDDAQSGAVAEGADSVGALVVRPGTGSSIAGDGRR